MSVTDSPKPDGLIESDQEGNSEENRATNVGKVKISDCDTGSSIEKLLAAYKGLEEDTTKITQEGSLFFSAEERSLLSETLHKFEGIYNDSVQSIYVYLVQVIPLSKKLCLNLVKLFDKYGTLDYIEWKNILDEILYNVQLYIWQCQVMLDIHEQLLVRVNEEKDKATVFTSHLVEGMTIQGTKAGKMRAKAKQKQKVANASAFVPLVGIIPALVLNASSSKLEENARSTEKLVHFMSKITYAMSDFLIPMIINFKDNIATTHVFLSEIKDELHIFHEYTENGNNSILENKRKSHFKIMKSKSKDIKRTCTIICNALSAVKLGITIKVGYSNMWRNEWYKKIQKSIEKHVRPECKEDVHKMVQDLWSGSIQSSEVS